MLFEVKIFGVNQNFLVKKIPFENRFDSADNVLLLYYNIILQSALSLCNLIVECLPLFEKFLIIKLLNCILAMYIKFIFRWKKEKTLKDCIQYII